MFRDARTSLHPPSIRLIARRLLSSLVFLLVLVLPHAAPAQYAQDSLGFDLDGVRHRFDCAQWQSDRIRPHLILEIHGGPFAAYDSYFSTEVQLYAAAGYVVLYANPRGSTSYGQLFGNAIPHDYPGHDFDDLMPGVDAVLERG